MVMDKRSIVEKMVGIAEQYNMEAMQGAGMQLPDMMNTAATVRPQLYKIQGDILDTLINEGILTINEGYDND
jgi:hypothetical protein